MMLCQHFVTSATGAETCALETCSFSKYAGFTGTRLGWTVIPDALKLADGSKVQVRARPCLFALICCQMVLDRAEMQTEGSEATCSDVALQLVAYC